MAVIGLNALHAVKYVAALVLLAFATLSARQSSPSEARAQVAAVAEALSSGDASGAMAHFAKSYRDYDTLRRYFEGLSAFQVENQLDVTDEEDTRNSVSLTVTWDITLTDLGSDRSRRRTGEIHAKIMPVGSKWRIVEFSPLDIFNPQIH